ncbi:recombinase family protein, partial [Klebsiella pneumoniae]
INTVHDLTGRGIGLKVLTGHGAAIDTTTAAGKLVFGIFAALAEFERELIAERTIAGLASARARGRKGGRPFKMTAAKLRLAMAAMGQPETKVGDLCQELGVTRQTLYRHVSPKGELRPDGEKRHCCKVSDEAAGNDSNLLIVFYVQIMPDDFVMQLHRF